MNFVVLLASFVVSNLQLGLRTSYIFTSNVTLRELMKGNGESLCYLLLAFFFINPLEVNFENFHCKKKKFIYKLLRHSAVQKFILQDIFMYRSLYEFLRH